MPFPIVVRRRDRRDGAENAGEKGDPHRDPDDPLRRCANKFNDHGNDDQDGPLILGVIGRSSAKIYLQETHRSCAR